MNQWMQSIIENNMSINMDLDYVEDKLASHVSYRIVHV